VLPTILEKTQARPIKEITVNLEEEKELQSLLKLPKDSVDNILAFVAME
jgi:hypothetical protein